MWVKMKYLYLFLIIFILQNCTKPKSVLICGDHVCVNKTEAEQYFEENLSIEVKIIEKKKKDQINLVELNLRQSSKKNKIISIKNKDNTKKEVKVLDNDEIKQIKKKIREKKKNKKNVQKVVYKSTDNKIKKQKNIKITKKTNNRKTEAVTDVCSIIKNCSIDEIAKYLLDQGSKKKFPDITTRE